MRGFTKGVSVEVLYSLINYFLEINLPYMQSRLLMLSVQYEQIEFGK